MNVLVVGGAGYIGSVIVEQLLISGHQPIVLDSLVSGHASSVNADAELVVADCRDEKALSRLFVGHPVDAVMYLGGYVQAGESMEQPGRYFANNIGSVIVLLNTMITYGLRRLIFSSSAAVYGEQEEMPIKENALMAPTSPYGEAKAVIERLLQWYQSQCGLNYVSLRYFNVAGATETLGEDHRPETHLIPVVLQAAAGGREVLPLYGSDYPTPDGSCIRDYIHVSDLARAHILSLGRLEINHGGIYNLGSGRAYSNREVIEVAALVTGCPISVDERPRRPGDPAVLVACQKLARAELDWEPKITDLNEIIESAWRWRCSHPGGYSS